MHTFIYIHAFLYTYMRITHGWQHLEGTFHGAKQLQKEREMKNLNFIFIKIQKCHNTTENYML